MPAHVLFFLFGLSFLSGVAFAGLGLSLAFVSVPASIVFAVLYATGMSGRIAAIAALTLVAGFMYYTWDDIRYRAAVASVPASYEVRGIVSNDPVVSNGLQSFYLSSRMGRVLVETDPTPSYSYGDVLEVRGLLKKPPEDYYGNYLAKEHVVATVRPLSISRTASGDGNMFYAGMYRLRDNIRASYRELLSRDEAVFLEGLTLGINEGFSKEFLRDLSVSGTRHLTAVSGLHMTIVIFIVASVFGYFLPRRYAFALTFLFVGFFVALTGFAGSAVRAAIMAFLAVLAKENGRLYSPHNALVLAALVLVLFNPKVLVYDVGFQLSFLAVASIIYGLPVVRAALRMGDDPGLFGWRQSLLTTLSAQCGTAPILMMQFHNFSFTALVANVLVLGVIPIIMTTGFFLAIASLIPLLAHLASLIASPLISYAVFIVKVAAHLSLPFNLSFGFTGIALYYGVLIAILFWFYRSRGETQAQSQRALRWEREISSEARTFEITEIR